MKLNGSCILLVESWFYTRTHLQFTFSSLLKARCVVGAKCGRLYGRAECVGLLLKRLFRLKETFYERSSSCRRLALSLRCRANVQGPLHSGVFKATRLVNTRADTTATPLMSLWPHKRLHVSLIWRLKGGGVGMENWKTPSLSLSSLSLSLSFFLCPKHVQVKWVSQMK